MRVITRKHLIGHELLNAYIPPFVWIFPKKRSKHTYEPYLICSNRSKWSLSTANMLMLLPVSLFPDDLLAGGLWKRRDLRADMPVCSTTTNKQPKATNYTSIGGCQAPEFTLQPLMRTFYLSSPVCGNSLCCLYHLVTWQYQGDSQVMCLYANQILMKQASCWLQS